MNPKSEQGSIMSIALFLIAIGSVFLVGILSNSSMQIRNLALKDNILKAQYAAEAAAKIGLQQAKELYKTMEPKNYPKITKKITLDPQLSASYSIVPNPATHKGFAITGTATYQKAQYKTAVNLITTPTTGSIVEKFNNARYSHVDGNSAKAERKWNIIRGSNASANPPDYASCQVIFDDPAPADELDGSVLDYSCACLNFDPTSNSTGYGIYYGVTNPDPDNMTGYIFQYDPGANEHGTEGSFFVKYVKSKKDAPDFAGDLEWNAAKKKYYNNKNWRHRTACWVPFQPNSPENGQVKVTLSELKARMERETGETFDLKGKHRISIDVRRDPDRGNKYRHIIKCDGYEILNFIDNTACAPKTLKGSRTGLRVWNAKVGFYNHGLIPYQVQWLKGEASLAKK